MNDQDLHSLLELKEPAHETDELDFIYDRLFTLGVPYNSDPEFKKYVFAAAKAYFLGIRSIDYTLKKYGRNWNFDTEPTELDKRFRNVAKLIKNHLRDNNNRIRSIKGKADMPGSFAAGAALIRLSSSFKSALILAKLGFFFEAACICRLILEQLAWAYSVFDLEDKSLFNTSVTKSVSSLKKLIPFSGQLYGTLSELAHISPKYTKEYIHFEVDDAKVIIKFHENLDIILYVLLLLLDIYQILTEVIYHPFLMEFQHILLDKKGRIRINGNRPIRETISNFRKKYIDQPNFGIE